MADEVPSEREAVVRETVKELAGLSAREERALRALAEMEPITASLRGGRGITHLMERLSIASELQDVRRRRAVLRARLAALNFTLKLPIRGRPILPEMW